MIVSDGKVIAIHTVNVDGTTIKGDGVKQPLSIDESKLPQYSVVAGNSNIAVSKSVQDNIVTFSLSAAGGGSGSETYESADEYVVVNNVNSTIGLAKDFVNSASNGYSALQVIQNNSATWERGTTYEPGENISITDENVISGRDWTSELNTKVNADSFNTWSAGVESSAANLSAAIDGLPKPKYYDDVSATVAENSANWDSVYYTVDSYSADWNEVSAKVDKTLFETWSTSVESSAAQMSAYIKSQEEYWNNSSYNVISTTPELLKVETNYDEETRETTFNLSATEPKSYSAGDGINIDDTVISANPDNKSIVINDSELVATEQVYKTSYRPEECSDTCYCNDNGLSLYDNQEGTHWAYFDTEHYTLTIKSCQFENDSEYIDGDKVTVSYFLNGRQRSIIVPLSGNTSDAITINVRDLMLADYFEATGKEGNFKEMWGGASARIYLSSEHTDKSAKVDYSLSPNAMSSQYETVITENDLTLDGTNNVTKIDGYNIIDTTYTADSGISISDDNGIAVKNDGETIKLNDENQLYTDFKTLSADNGLTNEAGIIKIDTSSLSANTQYVATVDDAGNFAWVSASSGTIYSAGNWIDSDEIRNGIIAVSGQKTLKTQLPLYFSADATDQNTVWICYDDTEKEKTAKAILIANGFKGGTYYDNEAGISATIPASDINAEYKFHFARQMGVQININAKFIAHGSANDMIGKVGFGAVSVSGQAITNEITYSMIGALGEQYYAASTIARVAAENFPEAGIDLSFKFLGDADFLKEIQNPCISLHEIVDEA